MSLGNRFKRLFAAVSITGLGDGLTSTAIPWLAATLTANVFLVGVVSTAVRLPWLLFSIPFGVIIDRYSPQRLMIISSFVRAASVACVAISVYQQWVNLPLLIVLMFLFGTAKVLFESTAQTMIPLIVERNQLEKANGLFVSAQLITTDILGGALSGLIIAVGLSLPFAIDAVAALVCLPLLMGLQSQFQVRETKQQASFKEDMTEGLRYVWRHPLLKKLAFLSVIMTSMFSAVVVTQVFFVREILSLESFGFGLLITVATVGSIVGGQCVSWLKQKAGTRTALLLSILVMSVAYALVGLSSSWLVVGALYLFAAFFVVVWNVLITSLRQRLVPDEMLGRVGGVFRFLSWGVSAIGMLMGSGLVTVAETMLGREWALRSPYFLIGVVYLALFFFVCRMFRAEDMEG